MWFHSIGSFPLALALVGACTGTPAPGGVVPSPAVSAEAASTTVRLSLESSATQLDGSPFWLAARLVPPSGAHLYWSNPGETGLATTAEFEIPRGYQMSEVRYPGPVSFRSERGAVGYGYEGSVALLVHVTPDRRDDRARFGVRASWLSCDALCVQERGEAELELGAEAFPPADLEPFIAALPRASAMAVKRRSEDEALLEPEPGYTLLEYFPLEQYAPDERAPVSVPEPNGRLLVRHPPGRSLRGVVRGRFGDEVRYLEVVEPPPSLERTQPESQ